MEQGVEIDGSLHEGGGQMIRSSLALSVIVKKQFHMNSIRKNRPNPGINNQLRNIFTVFTQNLPKVGSMQVYFYPKFLAPKIIKANTAASCSLMLQCVLPLCVGLKFEQPIKIQGGTDVSRSPPMQSVQLGLTPLLQKMGVNLKIEDFKKGYYPAGKGYIDVSVKLDGQQIRPIIINKIGRPDRVVITYYVKQKKVPGSAKQFQKQINKILLRTFGEENKIDFDVKFQKVFNTKDHYGIGCLILGDNFVWDVGTVGEPIDQEKIINRIQHYVDKRCALDQHHQDQLLLLASLAAGKSQLLLGEELSLHTKSLFYVINQFLPEVKFNHENGLLTVEGIGLKCGN